MKIKWIFLFVAFILSIGWIPSAQAVTHNVYILGTSAPYYSPANITIYRGDSIRWINTDAIPHTATADDGKWNTGTISAGQKATVTFTELGTFGYHCSIHPLMVGQVTVVLPAGEVNLASPTISIAITNTELAATGSVTPTPPCLFAISIDTDGDLLVSNDPGGSPGDFIKINPVTKAGFVFATESQVDAGQSTPTGDLDINGMEVLANGTIIISEYDGTDDIISVSGRTTSSISATSVTTAPGVASLTKNVSSGVLYYPTEQSFGGNDNVMQYPYPSGPASELISQAQIIALTGGSGFGAGPIAIEPDGKVLIWDEASFSGVDQILRIDSVTTTITVAYSTTNAFNGIAGGLSAMEADEYGNIYTWNEFRASGGQAFTLIKPNGTTVDIPTTDVQTQTGISSFDATDGGLKVTSKPTNEVVMYVANTPTSDIISFTFPFISSGPVVSPSNDLVLNPTGTVQAVVSGGTGPYTWSINSAGGGSGGLDSYSGATVTFTAGTNLGSVFLTVTDSGGYHSDSGLISVIATTAPIASETKEVIQLRNELVGTVTD